MLAHALLLALVAVVAPQYLPTFSINGKKPSVCASDSQNAKNAMRNHRPSGTNK